MKKWPHAILTSLIPATLAGLCNAVMATFIKIAADQGQSVAMTMFWRAAWGLFILFPLLLLTQKEVPLSGKIKTQHFGLISIRCIAGFISLYLFFYCLKHLTLAIAILLFFTSALFMPIVSFFWKGNKISYLSWIALAIGFLGVILVIKPGYFNFNMVTILGVISGLFAAIGQFAVHLLGPTDPPKRITFYYLLFLGIFGALITLFSPIKDWGSLTWVLIFVIYLGIGIFGVIYLNLLNYALKHGFPPLVIAFLYTSVIFAIIIDWLVWKVYVDVLTLIGTLLIIVGVVLKYYLHKDYRRR